MTSENELDIIKTVDVLENKEELSASTTPVEQVAIPQIEEQSINIDKPKRAARKKRDVDIKEENLNNDNAMDTQPLFEQPIIIEGKRSRKPTARLELSELTPPKKELSIPQGHGKPLGEIEYINYQITHASTDALSHMRNLCFGRRTGGANVRKSVREFNGFEFERTSEEYERHLSNLTKLKKDQLKSLSDILGLPSTGRNDEHAERILTFLLEPIDDGKRIPERKMSMRTSQKSSTNSKESVHTDEEENENGNDDDDDDDEIFNEEDEEEDEGPETDDDYIGSDEESGLNTKDDPDDFVYQPGKKVPKKRSSIKRSRSKTTPKRKRGSAKTSKRGRKRSKITVNKTTENNDLSVPAESIQTNNEQIDKINEDNSISEANTVESKNNDLDTNNIATDIIPITS